MERSLGDLTRDTALFRPGHNFVRLEGITADSRSVKEGYLFAALRGVAADGRDYIPKAIAAGATTVLMDDMPPAGVPDGIEVLLDPLPRRRLALFAARYFPAQPRTIVATTGTAGKTSVATFARQIFESAGREAASLGTVGVSRRGENKYGNLTTPDPVTLHKVLDELARDGVTHLAMEASSHGLDQERLDGVALEAAAFTNLGRDHLDYHPTMEDYLAAKMKLFEVVLPKGKIAVVNADCPEAKEIRSRVLSRNQDYFGIGETGDTLRILNIREEGFRQIVTLDGDFGRHEVVVPFAGRFQVTNALIAAGLSLAVGEKADLVFGAIGTLKGAKGRLEFIGETEKNARVVVDYAHKPDALREVLMALRPFTPGRLIVVFGAGGDRDPGKRSLMGLEAQNLADLVIVTDDNPRTEDPALIRAAILKSAPSGIEIADRREAIDHAVKTGREGDTILIAGKGHEPGQIVGNETLPFSDHEEALRAMGLT